MPDQDPVRLEDLVEDRRLELLIKKQDVASRAGVTPSYLRKVLTEKHPLTPDLAAGLERALEWPRGHLAPFVNQREPATPEDEHTPPDDDLDALIAKALRERERADRMLAELEREKQRRTSA